MIDDLGYFSCRKIIILWLVGVASTDSSSEPNAETTRITEEELPTKEDVYPQKSKRSVFFKDCETIFNNVRNFNEAITPEK